MACLRIHAMRVQTLFFHYFGFFSFHAPNLSPLRSSSERGHNISFAGNSKRTFKLAHFALQKYDIFLKYAS